jgi:hypothetical protein
MQLLGLNGFEKVMLKAGLQATAAVLFLAVPGNADKHSPLQLRQGSQTAKGFIAVEVWHGEVKEGRHEWLRRCNGSVQGTLSPISHHRPVAPEIQQQGEGIRRIRVIIYHHDG